MEPNADVHLQRASSCFSRGPHLPLSPGLEEFLCRERASRQPEPALELLKLRVLHPGTSGACRPPVVVHIVPPHLLPPDHCVPVIRAHPSCVLAVLRPSILIWWGTVLQYTAGSAPHGIPADEPGVLRPHPPGERIFRHSLVYVGESQELEAPRRERLSL